MRRLTCLVTAAALASLVFGYAVPALAIDHLITNENPPPAGYPGGASALLLDDISLGGDIRTCVGDNGALGDGGCPFIGFGTVGLRIDPDGTAGGQPGPPRPR